MQISPDLFPAAHSRNTHTDWVVQLIESLYGMPMNNSKKNLTCRERAKIPSEITLTTARLENITKALWVHCLHFAPIGRRIFPSQHHLSCPNCHHFDIIFLWHDCFHWCCFCTQSVQRYTQRRQFRFIIHILSFDNILRAFVIASMDAIFIPL